MVVGHRDRPGPGADLAALPRSRPAPVWTPTPPYYYTLSATPQGRTGVKLNRVFLPRRSRYARSRSSGFTRTWVGTVGTSLIHSCTSLIR